MRRRPIGRALSSATRRRTNLLDTEGRLTSYDEQLKHAPADIDAQINPDRMQRRHGVVQGAIARLGDICATRVSTR